MNLTSCSLNFFPENYNNLGLLDLIEVFAASSEVGVICAIVIGRPTVTPNRPITVLHFHYWLDQSPLEVMSTAVRGLIDRAVPGLNQTRLKYRVESFCQFIPSLDTVNK